MPRMMIVDDEETIRRGLSSLVERLLPEWEVVLVCEDAESALAGVRAAEPDLAIIDINMPGMDGLTLASELGKTMPELHKIMLTGYGKFQYAQAAMRYGVSDYLLKPLQRDEFVEAVRKIEHLMQEREQRSAHHLEKLLLEWFVSQSPERFRELQAAYREKGGRQQGVEYGVIVLFWDHASTGIDRLHIDLVASHLQQFTRGIREATGIVLAESCTMFLVSGIGLPKAEEWGKLVQRLGMDRRGAYRGTSRLGAFGCSDPFSDFEQLIRAYHQAVNGICRQDDEGWQSRTEKEQDWAKELTEALETNDSDRARELLEQWKEFIRRSAGQSPYRMTTYCIQFLAYLTGPSLGGIQSKLGLELREQSAAFTQRLPVALTPPTMLRSIGAFVDGLKLQDTGERSNRKVIVKVQQLIRETFADPELNLERLAQHVYLHPTYLSELFKETTGQKFIDYLTSVRMEEAKRYLKETDMKMYEVAAAVGYTSAKYFSTLFRKQFRLTPIQYRERSQ